MVVIAVLPQSVITRVDHDILGDFSHPEKAAVLTTSQKRSSISVLAHLVQAQCKAATDFFLAFTVGMAGKIFAGIRRSKFVDVNVFLVFGGAINVATGAENVSSNS